MSEVDLHGRMTISVAMDSQVINTATTTNGDAVDTALFNSLEYVIHTGVITLGGAVAQLQQADDASFTVNVEVVPAEETIGTLPVIVTASDDAVFRVGSVGKRRYQRLNLVSDATMNGIVAAVAIQGTPHHMPTADQSA